MVHGDLKGVGLLDSSPLPISNTSHVKANILIDENGHACLADFGLVTIISGTSSFGSSSQFAHGGTCRWMSPELFHPENFGLDHSRRTKYSDCYALGMVMYEVLSGWVPFYGYGDFAVVAKVGRGERPERPQGAEGKLFTDVILGILERCWMPRRDDRPSIEGVLQFLEGASKSWAPLSPPMTRGPLAMDSPVCSLSDPSAEENTGRDEVPSLTKAALCQPSHMVPPKGGADDNDIYPSSDGSQTLFYDAPDHQDLGVCVENPSGLDLEGPVRIPNMVGGTGPLDGFWY